MNPAEPKQLPWGGIILGTSVVVGGALIYTAYKKKKPAGAASLAKTTPTLNTPKYTPSAPPAAKKPVASVPGSLAKDPVPGASAPADTSQQEYNEGYSQGVQDGAAALGAMAATWGGGGDPDDYMTNYDSSASDAWQKGYKAGYRGTIGPTTSGVGRGTVGATATPASTGAAYAMLGTAVGVTAGYWGSRPTSAPTNAVIGGVVGGTLGFIASKIGT